MTEEQKQILADCRKYSYKTSAHVHFYGLDTCGKDDLLRYDKRAKEDIEALQKLIEAVQIYRMEITERYQELETQAYYTVVRLQRKKTDSKVWFYLEQWQEGYNDEARTAYSYMPPEKPKYNYTCERIEGKDRKKAIDKYNSIVKEHPEYKHILDIAKGKWER